MTEQVMILSVPLPYPEIVPDPQYDLVPPVVPVQPKRGRQCGLCGAKFDYGTSYGYCCANAYCPISGVSGFKTNVSS